METGKSDAELAKLATEITDMLRMRYPEPWFSGWEVLPPLRRDPAWSALVAVLFGDSGPSARVGIRSETAEGLLDAVRDIPTNEASAHLMLGKLMMDSVPAAQALAEYNAKSPDEKRETDASIGYLQVWQQMKTDYAALKIAADKLAQASFDVLAWTNNVLDDRCCCGEYKAAVQAHLDAHAEYQTFQQQLAVAKRAAEERKRHVCE